MTGSTRDDRNGDGPRAGSGAAGRAYVVRPGDDADGTGAGVLVLHSWWGLTGDVKEVCHRLADLGFVVCAPDLSAGLLPETTAEAEFELARVDPNRVADLVLSSAVALRSITDEPSGPVSVLGFGMGASWALWAATRQPETFVRVVAYYGTQSIDFSDLTAAVQCHFADRDEVVRPEEVIELTASLFESGREPEIWNYDARHGFAEPASADAYDPDAAALAWSRTVSFLEPHSPVLGEGPVV
ncbi:MAG: dienelactone hydrolase family protein [Microthrixaceae bacterium]